MKLCGDSNQRVCVGIPDVVSSSFRSVGYQPPLPSQLVQMFLIICSTLWVFIFDGRHVFCGPSLKLSFMTAGSNNIHWLKGIFFWNFKLCHYSDHPDNCSAREKNSDHVWSWLQFSSDRASAGRINSWSLHCCLTVI